MSKTNHFFNIIKNGGLFLVLIVVTFYFLLRGSNPKDLLHTLTLVNPIYVGIGTICMGVFISCEASNIQRSLKLFGHQVPFLSALNYAFVGSFFSSITPSATGGQPMQVYYMYKDKIDFSHATLALLIQLASYQTVTIIFALLGLATQFRYLERLPVSFWYLFGTGLAINVGIQLFILITIFSKNLSRKLIHGGVRLLKRFGYKRADELMQKADEQIEEYQNCAVYFRKRKRIMLIIFFTNCLQVFALQSIPYWVYRAFGFSAYPILTVIGLQAVLYISVSALPIPGAVGVSESGFLILFKLLFPEKILSSAMLLSRGISFYLFVFISGISVVIFTVVRRRKRIYAS